MLRSDGFYDYAWSPVTGCLHGCSYCYARKEYDQKKWDFTPTFHEETLIEPSKVKPCKIFVTHYTDMMGDFIPCEWVEKVIDVCQSLPKHTFIFITKNPINYYKFTWPSNCVLGVTIESPEKFWRAKVIEELKARKMASVEPLLGNFKGHDFSQFEQVVMGGLFGYPNVTKMSWVNSIEHPNIYYKNNVRQFLK